ncbi:MAG: aquaporin family protein [Bacteroidota bacterium]|nr:aquaporin family protein [Bacteroidota bacterium]
MKKYIVEFIGTFFLVLAVCMAGSKAGEMAPLAIGATLMVMIFAGGHVSGGHFNPAVTLAVFIRGKCDATDTFFYWVFQIAGGVVAGLLASKYFDYMAVAASPDSSMKALVAEIIGTFALAYVVLNVATATKTSGNSFYGLAIGFTVTAMAYTLGPVSMGAFNPAVAVGAGVFGAFAWNTIWIYLIGCLLGGALAGITYRFIIKPDEE